MLRIHHSRMQKYTFLANDVFSQCIFTNCFERIVIFVKHHKHQHSPAVEKHTKTTHINSKKQSMIRPAVVLSSKIACRTTWG